MKKWNNFGFTLVEMMIVVIIIGVLVGIAIPNYMRSVEVAKCSQAMGVLKNMRTAALDFFRENDTFSGMTLAALNTQVGANFADTRDWTFPEPTVTATTFTLTATRTGGPNVGTPTITLDELDVWGGSYPIDDPGGW
ncbi:MAG: prepilin-type N-terminal cleavage/methylation domain-containing protein [Candidatus Omnitrophota bacterium]